MAGHSKWSQIKRKKAITDQKRAKNFTKLLSAVQVAAKTDPNPEFNPRLRSAIEKAKEANVPQENINRAINKAKDHTTEELLVEAYGPEGTAFVIRAITDNKNRTMAELKKILSDLGAKFSEQGSVMWLFQIDDEGNFQPKFTQRIEKISEEKVISLMEAVDDHSDVSDIFTNAELNEGD